MTQESPPSPGSIEQILGISPLASETTPRPVGFYLLDFFGIYLFQQFFTVLMYALLSAFLIAPSIPDLFRYSYGENGAMGILTMPPSSTKQILLLGSTLLGNASVVLLYLIRGRMAHRQSWWQLGWRPFAYADLLKWVLIFFPLVLSFTMGYNALLKLLQHDTPTQQVASFLAPDRPLTLRIFALLLILLAAPITEEMLYRGILFPALERSMNTQAAAICSGLIFGIAHIEVMTILPLAFLGYLLALSFRASGSLWVPVILHTCNNFLAFLLLLWMPQQG